MSRGTQTTVGVLLLVVLAMVATIDVLGGWRYHPPSEAGGAAPEHPWTAATRGDTQPPEVTPAPEPLPPSYYLMVPYVVSPGGATQEP